MFIHLDIYIDCMYIYMWLSLLQAWVYQHYKGMAIKYVWGDIEIFSIHVP